MRRKLSFVRTPTPWFRGVLSGVIALAAAACGGDDADTSESIHENEWKFTDVTEQSGIEWTHRSVENFVFNMYDHGQGLAAGDFNDDGHSDLLLLTQCGPSGLYYGNGDGTFDDRSELIESLDNGVRISVTYADFDNDGDVDFYVTFAPGRSSALLRQNDDGTFTDVAEELGVAKSGHRQGATWIDVNRDGYLDLLAVGTVQYTLDEKEDHDDGCGETYAGIPVNVLLAEGASDPSSLYINGGPDQDFHFTDEAEERGIPLGGAGLEERLGFVQVSPVDFDRDGDIDLGMAEMFSGRTLLLANKDGFFTDVTSNLIPQPSYGAGSVEFADFNNDGWPDVFMADMHSDMWFSPTAPEESIEADKRYKAGLPESGVGDPPAGPLFGNSLWLNSGGEGRWQESAQAWHAETWQPWASVAADFDNDGDEDVFLPTGMSNPWPFFPDVFLENVGDGFDHREDDLGLSSPPQGAVSEDSRTQQFADVPWVASTRAAAYADFDEDGALDMAVLYWNDRVRLYRNDLGSEHRHWLGVQLEGVLPRDPIGAMIEVRTENGTSTRWMRGSSGWMSQSTNIVHFGLADADHVDRVRVHWLDGSTTTKEDLDVDTVLVIEQDD